MYVQADRTLDRSQGGLGIGLALVRRLVELHGGTVVAASQGEGHGSTFSLRLRQVPPPATSPHVPVLVERRVSVPSERFLARRDELHDALRAAVDSAAACLQRALA